MSEPANENPKTSRRSKRKAAMEPLGWDEIVSQPGMGGYLSFLNGPVPLPHLRIEPLRLLRALGLIQARRLKQPPPLNRLLQLVLSAQPVPTPDIVPPPAASPYFDP